MCMCKHYILFIILSSAKADLNSGLNSNVPKFGPQGNMCYFCAVCHAQLSCTTSKSNVNASCITCISCSDGT